MSRMEYAKKSVDHASSMNSLRPEKSSVMLTQYENLLKQVVYDGNYFGLKKLLEHKELIPSTDKSKTPNPKPLLIAIEKRSVCMINLLKEHGYSVPQPHARDCPCDNCIGNRFGQIKSQMVALRSLCNPVWISLSADDPFQSIFEFQSIDEAYQRINGSFAMEYEELYKQNEEFCVALLDQVKTESEGQTLMRHKEICQNSSCMGMEFVDLAINYGQKNVVSHSVVQYHLDAKVFATIPYWHCSGFLYKFLVIMVLAITYPLTSLVNIVLPDSCCPSVSEFAMRPFVKFVNGAASFITFIGLLVVMGAAERNGIRNSRTPTGVEIAVFVWVIGFCFGELKDLRKNGLRCYLNNGWNWVDIAMDFFMLVTYAIWFALYGLSRNHGIDQKTYMTTMFVADGTFCVAIVLSFFRLLYLCQASSYLGLIQICLGEMIMVIWQFMFVAIVNLLGFTVAMVYLFHSSYEGRVNIPNLEKEYAGKSAIYVTFKEYFYGFFSTLFTLIYVSLGVADTSTLENFEEGTLIHLWANLFFIVYIGVSMIVLLNMLIAMMSTSYQVIADNLHTEHLFSQTRLWMEYVSRDVARPVPFNMIPRVQTFINVVRGLTSSCSSVSGDEFASLKDLEILSYREVCKNLTGRYLRKVFGRVDFLDPPKSEEDKDGKLQMIESYIQHWKSNGDEASRKIIVASTSF